ncbi:MAG: fabG-2 [Aeromicrobium sp.]|jgi:NAD(P)-dependent dehydrogenase (short-subunit alcohol dehydrogenase family)|nr:fabG-2 [Aeromicrobium sp.]
MTQLDGKVAVVTGGGRGLGLAMARGLGQAGARVVIAGRSAATLDTAAADLAAEGINVLGVPTDVADPAAIEALFDATIEWAGRVDIAINNAGVGHEAPIIDEKVEDWDHDLRIMLTAPFLVIQQAARRMESGGAVVNISSIDARAADGTFAVYNAAKAGLISLTKSAAVEVAPLGLRVNSVSPGYALTDLVAEELGPDMVAKMSTNFERVPMKRMVTVEEVAHAVVFLAGPLASGITGTDLVVDGGTLANLYIQETLV